MSIESKAKFSARFCEDTRIPLCGILAPMKTAPKPGRHSRLYRRFLRGDARLDGRVWVAVRTTGIYCLPSCAARKALPQNVLFVASREEAERLGFRPCRRCRPEVRGGLRALEQAALRRWLKAIAEPEAGIEALARAAGSSSSRIYRLFRRHLGCGPREARARQRLLRACLRLRENRATVAEVAYEAGFGSLAAFYRWFRREMGTTPVAYRRSAAREFRGELR